MLIMKTGDKLIHIISNKIYTVGYMYSEDDTDAVLVDENGVAAIYPMKLIRGWFRLYEK
jgi:hypothetical protein